ncbi:prenyltransferase [Pseudothauera rhizosphaerae]|uniref:Prenyltransferase n=1 Tax=Pseudothauera rhizosphaerae TaxID=2565932 RepID=A0A4S4AZ84_9RHOO|nr:prenyltransferase [Pseudothauera rhizosphaerae]THF65039.1 prenyltransferase [Pseudothauera rhizosphaerae]
MTAPSQAPAAAAEPTPARFRNPLARAFAATRPAFLSVTLVACLLGLAVAHGSGVALDPLTAVATVLLALLAHAGGNVINDYHDRRADALNDGRLFPYTGGSRFIQNGVLSARQTAQLGYGLLAAAALGGLWLAWVSGPGLLAIGAAGLLVAWAYSAPPLHLVGRGLGEPCIVAAWLLVVAGSDYVQRGAFSVLPFVAGLSYALLVANLLYINQFPDHAGDAAAGKRTLVVRLGPQAAKWGYLVIALLAYIWLVLMVERNLLPQKAAAAALTLVISFHAARGLLADAEAPQALGAPIRQTIAAACLHGLVLAAALAFAPWPTTG